MGTENSVVCSIGVAIAGTLPFGAVIGAAIRDDLEAAGARLRERVPLAGLTTFRVGGAAAVLAECASTEALVATVRALDSAGVPTLILAGGSNLLVSDTGFDGVVVRVANDGVAIE